MVQMSNREHIDKNRLLYEPDTLVRLIDKYETPAGIKLNVKTTATQYEIRTALRFWSGGTQSYRTSDRVWSNLEAIENGEWKLTDDNEIVYA